MWPERTNNTTYIFLCPVLLRCWRSMAFRSPFHLWGTVRTAKRKLTSWWSDSPVTQDASMIRTRTCLFPRALVYACLTVCGLFRNPPASETVWRGLLQDLLDMQQNVYTCLEPETCHQVHIHYSSRIILFIFLVGRAKPDITVGYNGYPNINFISLYLFISVYNHINDNLYTIISILHTNYILS